METGIIVAIANNNAIGKNNSLLCHLPGDLKHFREITLGHTVIMGRNTFFSLPKGALPNRRNIVMTFDDETFEGCETARSVEHALSFCQEDKKVFFIGGASVYHQTYPLVDKLYLTFIHQTFDADTFFPPIDFSEWEKTFTEYHPQTEASPLAYTYENYSRITKKVHP